MKVIPVSLLFILLSLVCLARTEHEIDSLLQAMLEQNRAAIKETDLIGQWSRNGGFITSHLTLKIDNKFTSTNLTCIGKEIVKGKWVVPEAGRLRLITKEQTAQLYVTMIDGQICLWTEEEIKQVKALTVDYLKIGELQTVEEMEAFIRKGLIGTTYKKTAP